jgi:L-ascorbate metabolism protein UlaG (beta-lactamase superfamily)
MLGMPAFNPNPVDARAPTRMENALSVDSLGYVGHATTLIRLGETSVITDPLLRGDMWPLRRHGAPVDRDAVGTPDLILLSHLHRDHLDLSSLRSLPASIPTVVPRGAATLAARAGRDAVIELSPGEATELAGVEVVATPADHDGHRDRWGLEVQPLGFVVSAGERRVYFAGDTDLFAGMESLAPLDAALLPVWGWGPSLGSGHLNPERAAQALKMLRPKLAVPIHWGTLFPVGLGRLRGDRLTEPPIEFEQEAVRLAPEVKVAVLQPGESVNLDRSPGRRPAVA